MIDAPAAVAAFGMPPARAIRHLADKGAQVTGSWSTWLDGQHARAFTVANVAKLDVVTDIHDSLKAALKDGQTFEQWKRDLVPTLQRKGWWQKDPAKPEGSVEQLRAAGRVDQATGEIRAGLTPHRLRTIYSTNMQSAYMAGRHAEMMAMVSSRPYWQYVAVLDSKTRPAHRAMNGRVFRYDDAGWRSFYPPCGYNCRCRVRNLSDRDVKRKGLTVDSTKGKLSEVEVPLAGGRTAKVTRYTDAGLADGKFQPDPGFSNNPAQSVWMPRLADKPRELSRQFVRDTVAGPQFERFVKAQGQLQGEMPVGVLRDELAPAARDAVVYLSSDLMAAGGARHVPMAQWRLVADLMEYGRVVPTDHGLRLQLLEEAGVLEADLHQVDETWMVSAMSWYWRAAP